MILKIFLFSFSDRNIQFAEVKELTRKNHTIITTLPPTKKIKFINKKKFAAAVLDKKTEIFVVYIAILLATSIYPSRKAQIRALIAKDALI